MNKNYYCNKEHRELFDKLFGEDFFDRFNASLKNLNDAINEYYESKTTTEKPSYVYVEPKEQVKTKVYDNAVNIVNEYLTELKDKDVQVKATYNELLNFLCWIYLNKC